MATFSPCTMKQHKHSDPWKRCSTSLFRLCSSSPVNINIERLGCTSTKHAARNPEESCYISMCYRWSVDIPAYCSLSLTNSDIRSAKSRSAVPVAILYLPVYFSDDVIHRHSASYQWKPEHCLLSLMIEFCIQHEFTLALLQEWTHQECQGGELKAHWRNTWRVDF